MLIVSAGGCSITRGARRVPVCWCLVSGFPVRGLIVGGWCVRAGASLHDLPAGCGHSFQCGRRGTGCRSRCLRVFPGVLCAAYGCACLALCRRARIFLQGIPGGARCAASSAGRVSVPLSCRMICGALSAFWLSDCSAGRVLCSLPEFYNAPVCVQLHAAGFVGVKAAAFHHAGHTVGNSIATGGADGLPHQGRLPYRFAGDGIQGVKKHGSRLLSLCGLTMLPVWAG